MAPFPVVPPVGSLSIRTQLLLLVAVAAGLKTFSRKNEQPLAPTDVVQVMESALQLTA